MEWIFGGIGTAVISLVLGLIIGGGAGGAIGYRIAVNKIKQKGTATNHSTVVQIGGDYKNEEK